MDVDDSTLISQFVRFASQQAFATLVERHVGLVYSAARRQLGGDPAAAEDATQQVFVLLAQKAPTLESAPQGTPLTAWLFKTTRYVCANARRKQQRRALHERKAAEMKSESQEPGEGDPAWRDIAPLLDEAIDALPAREKDLVLSRFFEKRSFKEMGEQLRISEEAARKRVERATDKLRMFFARAGAASVPAAAPLAAALFENAVTQAPAALAGLVSTHAIGAVAGGVGVGGVGAGGMAATTASSANGAWGSILAIVAGKKAAVVAGAVLLAGGSAAVVVPAITQTASTPPPRQVSIAPPAMSATTTNGVAVELLGVSSLDADTWWQADGSALPAAPFITPDHLRTNDFRNDTPGARPRERFEFAFRARYANPKAAPKEHIFLQPVFQPNNTELMWETPAFNATKEPGLSRMIVGWELPSPHTAKVTVGVAAGPWKTLAETTTPLVRTEFAVRPDKPAMKMVFNPASIEDPRENPSYAATTRPGATPTTLPAYSKVVIAYPRNLWNYGVDRPDTRVTATTKDGKELITEHRQSGGIDPLALGIGWGDVHAFQTPPDQIASIRWQVRPYEPVVFESVSLKGGFKTEPKVALRPIGEPLSGPPKRR